MKRTTVLGNSNLSITRMGLGCMGMSEFYGTFDENESVKTLHKAIDLGVNFLIPPICMAGEQTKN